MIRVLRSGAGKFERQEIRGCGIGKGSGTCGRCENPLAFEFAETGGPQHSRSRFGPADAWKEVDRTLFQKRPRSILMSKTTHVIGDRAAEWQEQTRCIERH